jgi:hypothetical protein
MNATQSHYRRNAQQRFEDNDLANLLFNAIEEKAGSPGGRSIPDWAREQEIERLKQARETNVCTLNEFREHLGLKRELAFAFSSFIILSFTGLESFEEWNPDLANTARHLYDSNIDELELYVRLELISMILTNVS